MSSRYQLPNSLRYLKARLWFVKRPMFWGASAVLLLATFFIAEYWTQPGWFQSREDAAASLDGPSEQAANQNSSMTLPPSEDNSIGADIDSLPLLFSEIEGFEDDGSGDDAQDDELTDLFSESRLQGADDNGSDSSSESSTFESADSYIRLFQPFDSDDASSESDFDLLPTVTPPSTPSTASTQGTVSDSFNEGYPANSSSSIVLTNPLQSAMERLSSSSDETSAPLSNVLTTPSVSPQNLPSSILATPPSISAPNTSGANSPYYQTSPPPGTTGYTMPSTLRMMPSSPANFTPSGNAVPSVQIPGSSLPSGGYNVPAYTPPPQVSPQSQSSQSTPDAAVVQRTGPMYLPGGRRIEVSR
jgi:hypothetical protein